MNIHRKLFLFIICLLLPELGIAQNTNLETFFDKVHKRMSSHADSLSFTTRIRRSTQFMDSKWRVKNEIIFDILRHQNGRDRNDDILKAIEIENGKEIDVTQKQREELKKQDNKKGISFSSNGNQLFPFSPDMRKNYRFELKGDSLWNGRPVKIIHAQGQKESSDFYRGNYYIDSANFDVLGVDIRPVKNPKFVKDFRIRMGFMITPEGHYVLETFWMKTYANFLVKKVRLVLKEIYSDFQF